jgi:DNA-directed RNA polymerase subunit RPC12/RpoP
MGTPGDTWTQRRAKWRRYRVGRALVYIGFLLWLPAMVALDLAFKALGWADATMWIAVVWLAACAANMLWFGAFRCPACGKRFFGGGLNWLGTSNDWGSKCRNCGARPPV